MYYYYYFYNFILKLNTFGKFISHVYHTECDKHKH